MDHVRKKVDLQITLQWRIQKNPSICLLFLSMLSIAAASTVHNPEVCASELIHVQTLLIKWVICHTKPYYWQEPLAGGPSKGVILQESLARGSCKAMPLQRSLQKTWLRRGGQNGVRFLGFVPA